MVWGEIMFVLIIICRWILSCTVPILCTETQFYKILSVEMLPKELQALCTLPGQELLIFTLWIKESKSPRCFLNYTDVKVNCSFICFICSIKCFLLCWKFWNIKSDIVGSFLLMKKFHSQWKIGCCILLLVSTHFSYRFYSQADLRLQVK